MKQKEINKWVLEKIEKEKAQAKARKELKWFAGFLFRMAFWVFVGVVWSIGIGLWMKGHPFPLPATIFLALMAAPFFWAFYEDTHRWGENL